MGFPTPEPKFYQVAELESKPSQCPEEPVFVLTPELRASPHVFVFILTTRGGGAVWFSPSDEDLLKHTFFSLQTSSFIHTHPVLLPGDKNLKDQ